MTFKEIGEILRQERMQRGLRLEEVMIETKVSRRHIEAIEEGRVEDLPHPVYVKGFVKIYSKMLGVEVKGLNAALDEAFAAVMEDEQQEERRRFRSRDVPLNMGHSRNNTLRMLVIPLLLVLVLGTGYGVWKMFFADKQDAPQQEETLRQEGATAPDSAEREALVPVVVQPAPPPIELPGTQPSQPETAQPESAPLDQGQNSELPQEQNATADAPTASETATNEPPAEGTAVVDEALRTLATQPIVIASAEARAAQRQDVLILEVSGHGECWIEAKVDRDFTTDFYVREGERVEIWFTKVLAVKFGNLGMVSLRYNGAPYNASVPPGGVKTLTFPPAT